MKIHIIQRENGEIEGYLNENTKFLGKNFDEIVQDIITWRNKTYPEGIYIELSFILP